MSFLEGDKNKFNQQQFDKINVLINYTLFKRVSLISSLLRKNEKNSKAFFDKSFTSTTRAPNTEKEKKYIMALGIFVLYII